MRWFLRMRAIIPWNTNFSSVAFPDQSYNKRHWGTFAHFIFHFDHKIRIDRDCEVVRICFWSHYFGLIWEFLNWMRWGSVPHVLELRKIDRSHFCVLHDSIVSCLSLSVSVLMSNQKYFLEVAPVIPCEKSRGWLQDRYGMARGKKGKF